LLQHRSEAQREQTIMKQISVMIIEDSRVVREYLEHIISQDPRLRVVAAVGSGEEALKTLSNTAPDVISLDIRLPGMNGFELTKRIMSERPVPIVVVSSDVENEELKISMNALRAGALAVVQKPVGLSHSDYERVAKEICTKLAIMSEVRVIRQRYAFREDEEASRAHRAGVSLPRRNGRARLEILGIVASTGGPNALVRVLKELGRGFPAPIVLVQHITPGFVRGFVTWLSEVVDMPVVEATHGLALVPGTVFVAPADFHLEVANREALKLTQEAPISLQRPSGTVLFRSLARVFGGSGAGVLLTGMGEDGALGLRELFDAGGFTIAEDESTAVVFGMPAAAIRAGAACEVLPLPEIGPQIARQFGLTK
jgi:two-component system chemotaxis response regulator CheB